MDSPSSLWVTGEENGFPRTFGNYLLLAAFAQGGMGELFLAMNGSIAGAFRLCVVKKLRADLTNDKEYVNRFVDEARVVVQLNHANISHVFDIGRIEGQYYLAMEYVSGVSVKRLMARAAELDEQIPEDIAIFVAREVLEALDYAHQHTHPITGEPLHVVHRDVSPQNVLVSWAGEVKLIDFGLALSGLKEEHTATGAVMGKVAYMPPEQARGDEVTAACDQFATAVVTYEMMAGERYHGDLPLHAIWAIAGMGNFPPPKWSVLPRELQIILQRALHNDPFQRYTTCGDLREALGAYMAAHHPASGERNLRELLERWFRDYRGQERELLSRFKDVTGQRIREAVKTSGTEAESLISGPHARPPGWQMPPTEADARSISDKNKMPGSGSAKAASAPGGSSGSGSGSASSSKPTALPAPAPPIQAPMFSHPGIAPDRLDESRSVPLMPPPKVGGPSEQSANQIAAAAASLLQQPAAPPSAGAPATTPLAPPLGRTLTPPLATVGETTDRFARANGAPQQLATLTPTAPAGVTRPVTTAESTSAFMRASGAASAPAELTPSSPARLATREPPSSSSPEEAGLPALTPRAVVADSTEAFQRHTGASVPIGTLTPTSTLTESTAQFQSRNPATAPATLTPTAVVADTTAAHVARGGGEVRSFNLTPVEQPAAMAVLPAASFSAAAAAQAAAAANPAAPTAPAVAAGRMGVAGALRPSQQGPMGTAVDRQEPTERFDRRSDDEDDELARAFRKKPLWPFLAAGAGVLALVTVIAIAASSSSSSSSSKGGDDGTVVGASDPSGSGALHPRIDLTAPEDGADVAPTGPAPVGNGGAHDAEATAGRGGEGPRATASSSSSSHKRTSRDRERDRSDGAREREREGGNDGAAAGTAASTPVPPDDGAGEESAAAKRARDRVQTLKRSRCKDPCVGRIVGQLETMPNAVNVAGFRTSVDACIDACR